MGCATDKDRVGARCSRGKATITVKRQDNPRIPEDTMARIIVTTERAGRRHSPALLDERVCSAHLSDEHSAAQLIERLGWAISDAEEAEAQLSRRAAVGEAPTPGIERKNAA
jgi:hypothetical protein